MISQHVVFDEACFPFATSPSFTNNYEFLSDIDPVLSPIETRLNVGTPVTTANSLTMPLDGLTDPNAEVGGQIVPPGSLPTRLMDITLIRPDSLSAHSGDLTPSL
jgi:hypothetical protein